MFRFQSIDHIEAKIKGFAVKARTEAARLSHWIDRWDVYTACIALVIGVICGVSGLIYGIRTSRPPVTIERFALEPLAPAAAQSPEPTNTPDATSTAVFSPKTYVASKSGTKYHLPTCAGAKSIVEANKVWFSTKEEAEKAGYTPAGNCKGI